VVHAVIIGKKIPKTLKKKLSVLSAS